MPYILHILLRILAGIAGALLLYVAFFLYEDEEARIQNRLEEIWKRIDALQTRAMSKEAAFMHGVTRITSAILDRLLGHKLLSTQSIAVSMAYSLASLLIWVAFDQPPVQPSHKIMAISCALLVAVIGTVPAIVTSDINTLKVFQSINNSLYHIWVMFLVLVLPIIASDSLLTIKEPRPLDEPSFVYGLARPTFITVWLAIALGIVIDIFFITFFRAMLRKIAELSSNIGAVVSFLVAVSIVVVLIIGPAIALTTSPLFLENDLLFIVGFACATNFVDALCLLLLLSIMLLLLAHRLVWPLIKRPIYAANRKQLIKNSKLLGALGTGLLIYAFPHSRLVEWLTKHVPFLRA